MRVALVVMPWIDAPVCPLGAASLKAYLQAAGVETDAHYLHLRLAERIGLGLYTAMARSPELWPEWLFAHDAFGPRGTGELDERISDLRRLPSFRRFVDAAGLTTARLRTLLGRDVPAFLDECVAEVDWARYGVIGFSSTMYSHCAALALARRIKARHGAVVVFGGPNVQGAMGRETLAGCGWIDHVVDGEGEEAMLALVRAAAAGRRPGPIPRVTSRAADGRLRAARARPAPLDLARLPAPDHDDFFRELAARPGLKGLPVSVSFETSRGCWWGQRRRCRFCGIPDRELAYRALPVRTAARRVWALHSRYRAPRLYATDLVIGREHVARLLPALARRRRRADSDLSLFYESRADLSRAQIETMARAGVAELLVGIESLDADALRLMGKGIRPIRAMQTLKWGAAYGVKIVWNYLYGVPGAGSRGEAAGADAALALTHLQPPASAGLVRLERGSPYHARYARAGARPDEVYSHLYPRRRFDTARMAYGFSFPRGAAPAATPRRKLLLETLRFWAEAWPRNFFAARRGPDFVELHDCRPLRLGGGIEYRTHVLSGAEALVYRACESVRTAEGIVDECRRRGPRVRRDEVERALADMTRRRWLWREGDSYLALAVPLAGLPASQRVLFDRLRAAARVGASAAPPARVPFG